MINLDTTLKKPTTHTLKWKPIIHPLNFQFFVTYLVAALVKSGIGR